MYDENFDFWVLEISIYSHYTYPFKNLYIVYYLPVKKMITF